MSTNKRRINASEADAHTGTGRSALRKLGYGNGGPIYTKFERATGPGRIPAGMAKPYAVYVGFKEGGPILQASLRRAGPVGKRRQGERDRLTISCVILPLGFEFEITGVLPQNLVIRGGQNRLSLSKTYNRAGTPDRRSFLPDHRSAPALAYMPDQEFERLVQEGMAALTKSRERLKAHRDKPPDWEEITPEPLKPAVKHIRREFETGVWAVGEQIECGCYISLHPELATLPRYKGGDNLIRADLRETWHLQFEDMNEAERFAYWAKQYSDLLKNNVAAPFNAFLKIGLANESKLAMPAVEWAKMLTRGLLHSLKWTVPHLIKAMCDEQEPRPEIDSPQNFDEHCAWVWWRAPGFVYMHPSGNYPFDAATAWHRSDDAEFTEQLLRGLTGKMVEPAWFKLDRLAGEAYVSLASISHTEPSISTQAQASIDPAIGLVVLDGEIAQARERVKHFEGKIAAIDAQIAAFQQSLTHAIVTGKSTFRPADINKAISKLHGDKKELELRRDDWVLILKSVLKRAAGPNEQQVSLQTALEKGSTGSAGAHDIEGASIQSSAVPVSNLNPSVPSSPASMSGNHVHRAQPDKGKLPAKTTDLSKYLDGAKLTDRQRECFSLKFEYGLRVSEIVIRLGLSRKTVDEHIAAAKRRLDWLKIKERQKANSARMNPAD